MSASFCAVLPNYNDASTLRQSLSSLLAQSEPFDQIIVINDGSTDNSLEVLEDIRRDAPQLSIIDNGENLGIMRSVNIGLAAAREDFIFFASANDYFSSEMVKHAREAARLAPDTGLIAGKIRLLESESGTERIMEAPLPARTAAYTAQDYLQLVRARNYSPYGGATLVNRVHALAVGGFRQEMQWHSDWFLFAQLAGRHGFAYVPELFGTLTVSRGQYSESMYDWHKQGPLITAYINLLARDYPEDYHRFRAIGLMPSYDAQALPLLLSQSDLRHYLTPLLCWRLLTYKPARVLGRLLPYRMREKIRRFIRL